MYQDRFSRYLNTKLFNDNTQKLFIVWIVVTLMFVVVSSMTWQSMSDWCARGGQSRASFQLMKKV